MRYGPARCSDFKPDYKGKPSVDIRSINCCLLTAAGVTPSDTGISHRYLS